MRRYSSGPRRAPLAGFTAIAAAVLLAAVAGLMAMRPRPESPQTPQIVVQRISCAECLALLERMRAGPLSPADEANLDEHVSRCGRCLELRRQVEFELGIAGAKSRPRDDIDSHPLDDASTLALAAASGR